MGQKLLDMYNKAIEIGGGKAKMRLAILTLVPSAKAGEEPDSDENIKKFEEALKKIKEEN